MNIEFYCFLFGIDINVINKIGSVLWYINDFKYDICIYIFFLIFVKDIYWDGFLIDCEFVMFFLGNYFYLIILLGVCLLLFFIGILNFINFYLVVLLCCGKEYGLKKVFGVCGKILFVNIWIENILLVLSVLLVFWFIIEIMFVFIEYLFDIYFFYMVFDGWFLVSILLLLLVIIFIYLYIKYNYIFFIFFICFIGV